MQGAYFVIYAWNILHIDVMYIICYFSSKEREFALPINLTLEPTPQTLVIEDQPDLTLV